MASDTLQWPAKVSLIADRFHSPLQNRKDIINKEKSTLTCFLWNNILQGDTWASHIYIFFCPVTFYPLSQGYLSSVLWPVSLLAFLLHTEDSSVYERDKERRYNCDEEWGTPKRSVSVQIVLNEAIGIDSGLLCLTYCHSVGIIPLVMSCLPHEIVCCS